jgi:hypothetical protein
LLLVYAWHEVGGDGTCGGSARRYDALGATRGSPGAVGCFHLGAAVSSRGEALVLEDRRGDLREVWIHWLRADGSAARAASREGLLAEVFQGGAPELAPLLDGSIAVSDGGRWTRRSPHLSERSEAAPAWLAGQPVGTTFRNTRGNRGYALFPPPAESADCSQAVELRAPSGRLCGKVTLRDPGGSCRAAAVDQGWDGTVVQASGPEPCSWRWWPRLLAR